MEQQKQGLTGPSELNLSPLPRAERSLPPTTPPTARGDGDPKFDRTVMVRLNKADELIALERSQVPLLHIGAMPVIEPLSATLTGRFVRLATARGEGATVGINTIIKFFRPNEINPGFTAQLCSDWIFEGRGEKVAFVLDDGQIYQVDQRALPPDTRKLVNESPLGTLLLRMNESGAPPPHLAATSELESSLPGIAKSSAELSRLAAGLVALLGKRGELTNDDLTDFGGYIHALVDLNSQLRVPPSLQALSSTLVDFGREFLRQHTQRERLLSTSNNLLEIDWKLVIESQQRIYAASRSSVLDLARAVISYQLPEQRAG